MAILVTGGAGYIGSVNVALLRAAGREVVVLDNLSRGFRTAVAPEIPFYQGDVGDRQLVGRIVRAHRIEVIEVARRVIGRPVPATHRGWSPMPTRPAGNSAGNLPIPSWRRWSSQPGNGNVGIDDRVPPSPTPGTGARQTGAQPLK